MAFKRNNNVIDSPGNSFATLNVLATNAGTTSSDGNLKVTHTSNQGAIVANISIKTGKFYWEIVANSSAHYLGIAPAYYGGVSNASSPTESIHYYYYDGNKVTNGGSHTTYGSAWGAGNIIGVLLDKTNNTVTFYVDNVSQGPISLTSNTEYVPSFAGATSGGTHSCTVNFGQDPTFGGTKSPSTTYTDDNGIGSFHHEPPTGALALCTANLPSFDGNPQEHFKPVAYQVINQNNIEVDVNVGFNPDLTWIKCRDAGENHYILDTVRDSNYNKLLKTNSTTGELDISVENSNLTITKKSTRFSLETTDTGVGELYFQDRKYICWNWKAGGSGGKYNIDGVPYLNFLDTGLTADDITPDGMSVNTKAGFSIVKYTASTSVSTVPHGLSKKPELMIFKNIDTTSNWDVITDILDGSLQYLWLNSPNDVNATGWGSSPTDLVMSVYSYNANMIAYCWHSVAGYSKIGSYVGNGSADGPFIYTGFKPAFLMIKRTDADNNWYTGDTARTPFNPGFVQLLSPNTPNGEGTDAAQATDFLENGFKFRTTQAFANGPTGQYIYMAFAEHSM